MGGGRGKLSKVVAGVVLALLLAACAGGTGPDNPPSAAQLAHSAFITQSGFICQATLTAQEQLPSPPGNLQKLKPGSPAVEAYAYTVDKSAMLSKTELGKLRKLLNSPETTVPQAERKAFSQYLTSLEASIRVSKQYAQTLRADGVKAAQQVLQRGPEVKLSGQLQTYAARSQLEQYCGGQPPKTATATITTPATTSTSA